MGFLTDQEIAELNPSELLPYATPIPTQIVSSDEFTPPPQSEKQKEVEARLLYNYDTSKRTDIGPNRDRFALMKEQYEGTARRVPICAMATSPARWIGRRSRNGSESSR